MTLNVDPEAVTAAYARRDAMIDAVEKADLVSLDRLSNERIDRGFVRGARYRLVVLGGDADVLAALDPTLGLERVLEQYVDLLRAMTVREVVGQYLGRATMGIGETNLFHRDDHTNAAINDIDVLAVERLDADA